jgi:opacity protein-like surface antigen
VPKSAFFVGVGGGYSFTNFGGQAVYNKGISNVFQSGVLTATGTADGPAVQSSPIPASNAVPAAQLGYFRHFGDSPWLWGAKLSYSYLGTSSSVPNLVIPQFGSTSNPGVSSFSGFSVTGAYSVAVYHQTSFMPFVGRSFDNSFFYVGAGPSVSQTQANLTNVVGFATINGKLVDISGAPQSFSSTNWNYGVAGTAGVTYFLGSSWFLDLSYSFSMPNGRTTYVTSPFNNPGDGTTAFSGTLIGTYTANLSTEAIAITINKTF